MSNFGSSSSESAGQGTAALAPETAVSAGKTPTLEYRTRDKTGWARGPWDSEPDKRQWHDDETDLPCLIVRGPSGALCGYVGVAPDHPAYGLDYDHWSYGDDGKPAPLTPTQEAINAIEVHGGLTFASGCRHSDDPSRGICHIPAAGAADHVWWFGFDCAHCNDLSPAWPRSYPLEDEEYRTQGYVEREVRKLAKQLKALEAA